MRTDVERSIGLVTVLSPLLGYENATLIAQKAQADGSSVRDVVLELGLMTAEAFDAMLGDVDKLVRPNN
jgi:aspartate ammonia-lyase